MTDPRVISEKLPDDSEIRFGEFRLSKRERRLYKNYIIIPLRSLAFDLLSALVERGDDVLSNSELCYTVWKKAFVSAETLKQTIFDVRKAVGFEAIQNIPGRGYRFAMTIAGTDGPATALPAEASGQFPAMFGPLIGRNLEVAKLSTLIETARAITIVGSSGIGKTRLALEVARRVSPSIVGDMRLVDLALVTDPIQVPRVVAAAVGAHLQQGADPSIVIADAIGDQRLLLVLDNCEHVVGAIASIAQALLARAPGLVLLATSHEALRVPDEVVWRLEPLALPPEGAVEIDGYGAAELFVARARAADCRFDPGPENVAAIGAVCRSLDGLPLAIEMAAARLPFLGLEGLKRGLGEPLRVLGFEAPNSAWRHSTLRRAIEWSYSLLVEEEQRAFHHLAVFPGSFSLDAAVAVIKEDGFDYWDATDLLGRLADKSLVTVILGNQPRYRLLETLRLFARERLEEAGELDKVAERHILYFTDVFEEYDQTRGETPHQVQIENYGSEIENARAAAHWGLREAAYRPMATRLLAASAGLWSNRFFEEEFKELSETAILFSNESTSPFDIARLHVQIGYNYFGISAEKVIYHLELAVEIFRAHDFQERLVDALGKMVPIYLHRGYIEKAETCAREAYELGKQYTASRGLAHRTSFLGMISGVKGDIESARYFYKESLDILESIGDRQDAGVVLCHMAQTEFDCGNLDEAIVLGRRSVQILKDTEYRVGLSVVANNFVLYLLLGGVVAEALFVLDDMLSITKRRGGFALSIFLQNCAHAAAFREEAISAARLIGFVDAMLARSGERREALEVRAYAQLIWLLEETLGRGEVNRLMVSGARLTEARAVLLAEEFLARILAQGR